MATAETDKNTTWNFGMLLGQGILVNARYQIVSAHIVMPFIYVAIGAPVVFAGLLLPVAQLSVLISQLALAPLLNRAGLRKWYIALALTIMAIALAIVALAAHNRISENLAAFFLLLAAVLGISRGMASLAYQDLVGRILPRERRGKLLFTQSALAGLITIALALASQYFIDHPDSLAAHLELIWIGAALTVIALIAVICIREPRPAAHAAGAPATSRPRETTARATLLKDMAGQARSAFAAAWFRRYLVARNLLLSVELAMPFYAMHAAAQHADKHESLSLFVIGSSIGLIGGGLLWERVGRASIPSVMGLASVTAAAAGALAIGLSLHPSLNTALAYGGVFFLAAVAAQGARIARRLYIVNATTDAERPGYIAVANAVGGVVGGSIAFAFGLLAQYQDVSWPIWCIVVLNVAAALYTVRLAPRTAVSGAND